MLFYEKWNIVITFADRGKSFDFPERFFRHDCHKCIIHVHWNALRKKKQLWKQFCLFLSSSDKGRYFLDLCQNLPTWLSKLFSTCRLAHFEGNSFSFEQKLIIILSCSDIEWICLGKNYKSFTFPDICRTYLHGVLQTDFYVNRATFWV